MGKSHEEHSSLFVAGLTIDTPNLIVETLFKNKIDQYKWPVPKCAFWRKEHQEAYPKYKAMAANYSLELSAIRDLLKVFAPKVVISAIVAGKYTSIKFLNREEKAILLYRLFMDQVKLIKSIEEIDIPALEEKNVKNIARVPGSKTAFNL